MAARDTRASQKFKDRRDALELKYKEILANLADLTTRQQADLKKQGFCNSDTYIIDSLELEIDGLKAQIQCRDLVIDALNFCIETNNIVSPLVETADAFKNKVLDAQEGMITDQTAKIDKYQKGPKQKSADSQQKWALANEYLKDEIPKNKTLKAARLAAAKRAGIVAEERQLTKMMPISQ